MSITPQTRDADSRLKYHRGHVALASAVLLLGCQLPLEVMDPVATELAGIRVDVPARIENGMMIVDVLINDRGPFAFLVDTDARMTFISSKIAAELKLPISIPEVNLYFDSRWEPTREVAHHVDSLRLGGATFRDLNVVGMGSERFMDSLSQKVGTRVCGFIGYNTFVDCLVTIDFGQKLLRIERGRLDPTDPSTLPMRPDIHNPVVTVRFGSVPEEQVSLDVKLDTGSNGGIEMPPTVRSLPFESTPMNPRTALYYHGIGEKRRERLQTIAVIGNQVIQNPAVSFYEGGAYLDSELGRIGTEVLKDYRMTFDSRSKLVRIVSSPPDHGPGSEGTELDAGQR